MLKALGVSADAVFNPAGDKAEAEIQEIAGLCRACPERGRGLILAAIRAVADELMDTGQG